MSETIYYLEYFKPGSLKTCRAFLKIMIIKDIKKIIVQTFFPYI